LVVPHTKKNYQRSQNADLLFCGDLFINRIDILGRICLWGSDDGFVIGFIFLHDSKGNVTVITVTSEGAVGNDGEHPEHANENTYTAADYKGYCSTLPLAEIHKGVVKPGQKWFIFAGVIVVIDGSIRDPTIVGVDTRERKDADETTIDSNVVILLSIVAVMRAMVVMMGMTMMLNLNQRPTERLSEAVTNLDRLNLDLVHEKTDFGLFAMAAWTKTGVDGRDWVYRWCVGRVLSRRRRKEFTVAI